MQDGAHRILCEFAKKNFCIHQNSGGSALLCTSEVGEHLLRHYKCWRNGEVSGGALPSSLIQQHNGIMSARFCQNGSDRDCSGIRHDFITDRVSIQELG